MFNWLDKCEELLQCKNINTYVKVLIRANPLYIMKNQKDNVTHTRIVNYHKYSGPYTIIIIHQK